MKDTKDGKSTLRGKRQLFREDGPCRAALDEYSPCHARAVKGEAFCRLHIREGYALFTLAALEPARPKRFARKELL